MSAPAPAELRAALDTELARLGVDPQRITTAAPQGARNRLKDAIAYRFNSTTQSWSDPNCVKLTWTEQLVGDYDQNGEVNINDLSALGANFGVKVQYRTPGETEGLLDEPLWESDDGYWEPFPQMPDPGSPPDNWRKARVDGDANGEINLGDISPLAAHLGERLAGYRVYRRAGGAGNWELQPNRYYPSSSISVLRLQSLAPGLGDLNPAWPVRYEYLDIAPPSGEVQYKVVPCCSASGEEGEPTLLTPIWYGAEGLYFYFDIDNSSGYCQLGQPVSFSFGGAGDVPLTCMLDNESDGIYDYRVSDTTEPVEHSAQHTYPAAGLYTVTFRIEDGSGRFSMLRQGVLVIDNHPPQAALTLTPLDDDAPCRVQIDVSGCGDPDPADEAYIHSLLTDMNFSGNPRLDIAGPEAYAGELFGRHISPFIFEAELRQPGTYTLTLTVTDRLGEQGTATKQLVLTAGGRRDPYWDFATLPAEPAGFSTMGGQLDVCPVGTQWGMAYLAPKSEIWYCSDVVHAQAAGLSHVTTASGDFGYPVLVQLAQVEGIPVLCYYAGAIFGASYYCGAVTSNGAAWYEPYLLRSGTLALPAVGSVDGRPACAVMTYSTQCMLLADDISGQIWTPLDCGVIGVPQQFISLGGTPAVLFWLSTELSLARATDAHSSSWQSSIVTTQKPLDLSGAVVAVLAGRPAVAYRIAEGIALARAADEQGAAWYPSQLIAPLQAVGGGSITSLDLAVIGGRPWLCYYDQQTYELRCMAASDPGGIGWLPAQVVDSFGLAGGSCQLFDAAESQQEIEAGSLPGIVYIGSRFNDEAYEPVILQATLRSPHGPY
jgi:hypothetical protein